MNDIMRHADGTLNWQHYASKGSAIRSRALRASFALAVRTILQWIGRIVGTRAEVRDELPFPNGTDMRATDPTRVVGAPPPRALIGAAPR